MKRFFFLVLFLATIANYAGEKKNILVPPKSVEVIYYPHENSFIQAKRTYDKQENLKEIVFGEFPKGANDKISSLVFSFKPNQFYQVKEFDLDKKLKFIHTFKKQKNGYLHKAYYPHDKKEKIQSSKILYQITKFNLSGKILSKTYYDKFNKPTPNDTGIASYKYVYDTKGNLIQQVTKDWKNRVHPDKDGIGIYNFTYDNKNQLTSKTYFRKEGVPKAIDGNISKVEYGYDESCFEKVKPRNKISRLLSSLSFKREDLAVNCINSVKNYKFSPECLGYCPAEDKHGIHSYLFHYDEKCLLNRTNIFFLTEDRVSSCMRIDALLNVKAENIKYPLPYSVFTIEDNKEKLDSFDQEEKLKSSLIITKFIEEKTGIKTTVYEAFGPDKMPVLLENISRAITKEDAKGNLLSNEYFGIDGQQAVDESGVSKEVFEYDSNCLMLKKNAFQCIRLEERFGSKGFFIKEQNGKFPRIQSSFDGNGNKTKTEYYILKGEKEISLYYSENFVYDNDDKLVSKKIFSEDGKPFALENGVHSVYLQYDKDCLRLNPLYQENCFSLKIKRAVNGKLAEFFVAKHFQKFNNGVLYYSASYNKDNTLENNSKGYAKMQKTLDKKGNVLQIQYTYQKEDAYFSKLQKALGANNTYPVSLETYHMNSNRYLTIHQYNSMGKLMQRQIKDEKNREVEFETFNARGELDSYDYSLNFYLKNKNSFHIKLDKFKRPVDVEFISLEVVILLKLF